MKRLLAALLLLSSAARAADCAPAKREDQIALTPVIIGPDAEVEAVPVSLNGQQVHFILDTGGVVTQIGAGLAASLKIPVNRTSDALVDVTGHQAAGLAMIHDFTLGSQTRHDVPLPVSPNDVVPTGLLALNDLTPFDVEMDFPRRRLAFYSPDHCPGINALGPSSTVIPFQLTKGHIAITALLDGKPVTAILDTGSTATNLSADIAQSLFGVVPGAPDTPANGALNGTPGLITYDHVFRALSFGPVTLAAPHVTIIPAGSAPGLIIGMNVLKTMDLYIAFREGKIHLAPPPQNP